MTHIDIFAKFLDMFFGVYHDKVDAYTPAGKDTIWVTLKDGSRIVFNYVNDRKWFLAPESGVNFNEL